MDRGFHQLQIPPFLIAATEGGPEKRFLQGDKTRDQASVRPGPHQLRASHNVCNVGTAGGLFLLGSQTIKVSLGIGA